MIFYSIDVLRNKGQSFVSIDTGKIVALHNVGNKKECKVVVRNQQNSVIGEYPFKGKKQAVRKLDEYSPYKKG